MLSFFARHPTGIVQEESPVQGAAVALQENYRSRTSRKPDTGRQLSEKNIARIWIFCRPRAQIGTANPDHNEHFRIRLNLFCCLFNALKLFLVIVDLKNLATEEGYESFVVPDDVGGRFSVLTAVGLLPIAVSGADITALMEGAASMREKCLNKPFEENDSMLYAAVRNILLRKNKSIEILCNYEPSLHYVGEWWKQLYGESEGKDQKGIFPAAVDLTTDLHSMGQFIQDGQRTMFETVINLETPTCEVILEKEDVDLDGLNYLCQSRIGTG